MDFNVRLAWITVQDFGDNTKKVGKPYFQTIREQRIDIAWELYFVSCKSSDSEARKFLVELNQPLPEHLKTFLIHLKNPKLVPGQPGRMRLLRYVDPIDVVWPKDEWRIKKNEYVTPFNYCNYPFFYSWATRCEGWLIYNNVQNSIADASWFEQVSFVNWYGLIEKPNINK